MQSPLAWDVSGIHDVTAIRVVDSVSSDEWWRYLLGSHTLEVAPSLETPARLLFPGANVEHVANPTI